MNENIETKVSVCRCCAKTNYIFCNIKHYAMARILELIPNLLDISDPTLSRDICTDCYQMIKTLIYNIESIKDTQKILKIKSIAGEKLLQFQSITKKENPNLAVTKSPLPVLSRNSTNNDDDLVYNEEFTRKRPSLEEIEKKYTNLKLRKISKTPTNKPSSDTSKPVESPPNEIKLYRKLETLKKSTQKPPLTSTQQQSQPVKSVNKSSSTLAQQILSSQSSDKINEQNRSFMCISCSKKFPTFSNLDDHLKHSCKLPYNSEFICFCKKVYKSKEELSNHVSAEHQQYKRHVCPTCTSVFTSLERLREHLLTHNRSGGAVILKQNIRKTNASTEGAEKNRKILKICETPKNET